MRILLFIVAAIVLRPSYSYHVEVMAITKYARTVHTGSDPQHQPGQPAAAHVGATTASPWHLYCGATQYYCKYLSSRTC